jgi:hypothetical protein
MKAVFDSDPAKSDFITHMVLEQKRWMVRVRCFHGASEDHRLYRALSYRPSNLTFHVCSDCHFQRVFLLPFPPYLLTPTLQDTNHVTLDRCATEPCWSSGAASAVSAYPPHTAARVESRPCVVWPLVSVGWRCF